MAIINKIVFWAASNILKDVDKRLYIHNLQMR